MNSLNKQDVYEYLIQHKEGLQQHIEERLSSFEPYDIWTQEEYMSVLYNYLTEHMQVSYIELMEWIGYEDLRKLWSKQ